jgi:hypothetical protein
MCPIPKGFQDKAISLYNSKIVDNVTDLFKAFLGNGSVNTVNVQKWKMSLSGRMLLLGARQQPAQQ